MTPEQRARFFRSVLYLISKRKWKNGCLVGLAKEALSRADRKEEVRRKQGGSSSISIGQG